MSDVEVCDPHNPVGVEIRGFYDGVAYWQCMVCGHRWHRFPEGDYRRATIERIWEGN